MLSLQMQYAIDLDAVDKETTDNKNAKTVQALEDAKAARGLENELRVANRDCNRTQTKGNQMATEAEAREVLIITSHEILYDVVAELADSIPDEDTPNPRPLTGVELEDLIKKLYRVSQTLKTAQSLSTV